MHRILARSLAVTLALSPALMAQSKPSEVPVEYGRVQWLRDLDQGLQQAAESDRPVFLFFQEVPG